MRLDAEVFRYLTPRCRRVLLAIESGHRDHRYVPLPLIGQTAGTTRGGTDDSIKAGNTNSSCVDILYAHP